MGKFVLSLMVISAVLSGCSPTDSGNSIADYPLANPGVSVTGIAQLQSSVLTGKASYSVTCAVQYTDRTRSNSDFNSAIVTVNGTALGRYSDGVFVSVGAMSFAEGDSLEFIIKHPKIGTVEETVRVPAAVSDYSVSPSLPVSNMPNARTTYSLAWQPVNANYYYLLVDCYDSLEHPLTTIAYGVTPASYTVTVQDSTGHPYPFLQLRLLSVNGVTLPEFSSGSSILVTATYCKVYTNL